MGLKYITIAEAENGFSISSGLSGRRQYIATTPEEVLEFVGKILSPPVMENMEHCLKCTNALVALDALEQRLASEELAEIFYTVDTGGAPSWENFKGWIRNARAVAMYRIKAVAAIDIASKRVAELEEENKRLREALEYFVSCRQDHGGWCISSSKKPNLRKAEEIAIKAMRSGDDV